MIALSNNEKKFLKPLCKDEKDITLWSAIDGNIGKGWIDNKENPEAGIVIIADYCYLLGSIKATADEGKLKEILNEGRGRIIPTRDENWLKLIKKLYPESYKSFNRFATNKELSNFNKGVLEGYVADVEGEFKISRIDENLFHKVVEDPFMADCCCFYESLEAFIKEGIGYVIVHNDEIIAGASSYSTWKNNIDITIGTKEAYRGKGLAKAVAAKVILESLERHIYPGWDAVDMRSITLAEKLGYVFDKEYEVCMI